MIKINNCKELILHNGIKLKLIPSGTFKLGRLQFDNECAFLNEPLEVTIEEEFWISETPITNYQYKKYLTDTDRSIPNYLIEHWNLEWKLENSFEKYFFQNLNAPVVGVNYQDAIAYITWLNEKNTTDMRLPTEAEFEWASKANCQCTHYCINAINVKNSVRNYGEPARKFAPCVKMNPANNFGLYDMQGLIWQWCSDWYWDYNNENIINPTGPNKKPEYAPWRGIKSSSGRVIRGGSFNYGILHSRCASRHYSKEEDRNFNLGFRICGNT